MRGGPNQKKSVLKEEPTGDHLFTIVRSRNLDSHFFFLFSHTHTQTEKHSIEEIKTKNEYSTENKKKKEFGIGHRKK